MPVYLAHGFRWRREGISGIKAWVILNNLEDAATEYLQTEQSANAILESFREHFSPQMEALEKKNETLYFLEPYDPTDETSDTSVSQPYCFVADRVVTMAAPYPAYPNVKEERPVSSSSRESKCSAAYRSGALSLNLEDTMSKVNIAPEQWNAMAELRDKLAEGESLGWFLIYNGDVHRSFDEEEYEEGSEDGARTPTQSEPLGQSLLGQPLPSLLPSDFKASTVEDQTIGLALPHPPPTESMRPKSSRSFTNPLKKRSSKANLLPPKGEPVPDLPKLKEISKKEGFRRFFGRSSDRK